MTDIQHEYEKRVKNLEMEKCDLVRRRKELIHELDNLDTKLIGLNLDLDRLYEKEKIRIEDERSADRLIMFDDD